MPTCFSRVGASTEDSISTTEAPGRKLPCTLHEGRNEHNQSIAYEALLVSDIGLQR